MNFHLICEVFEILCSNVLTISSRGSFVKAWVLGNSFACGGVDIALFNKFITEENRGSKYHNLVAIDQRLR